MTVSAPDYFYWLSELVCVDGRYTDESYWELAKILFDIPFTWKHPMDENRAIDGEDLRDIYYDSGGDELYEGQPCNVLEMLIALSRRIDDILDELDGEDRIAMYFWEMIDNLGLSNFSDRVFEDHPRSYETYIHRIESRVRKWLDRDISFDGHGGLFPLQNAKRDQREIEIWYQACAYLDEHYND